MAYRGTAVKQFVALMPRYEFDVLVMGYRR